MKMSELKHDADAIKRVLVTNGDKLITKEPIRILIPSRYRSRGLADVGSKTKVLGIFMYLLDNNKYGLSMAPTMLTILPDDTKETILDGQETTVFYFEKGSIVLESTETILNDKLLYHIYNEIVSMGNVPAFMDYHSLGRLFDFSKHFAGTNPSPSIAITHLLVSLISRDPKDLTRYFRQSTDGKNLTEAVNVAIRSTTHGATNTTAKIMGGYFSDKVTSALVNPAKDEEPLEHILRS